MLAYISTLSGMGTSNDFGWSVQTWLKWLQRRGRNIFGNQLAVAVTSYCSWRMNQSTLKVCWPYKTCKHIYIPVIVDKKWNWIFLNINITYRLYFGQNMKFIQITILVILMIDKTGKVMKLTHSDGLLTCPRQSNSP